MPGQYRVIPFRAADGTVSQRSIVKNKLQGWVFCDEPGTNVKRRSLQQELEIEGQSFRQSWYHAFEAFPQVKVPKEDCPID